MAIPQEKRPTNEELREAAARPGMTYVKLGNMFQVHRNTVKKWCQEAGIEKLGHQLSVVEQEIQEVQSKQPTLVSVPKQKLEYATREEAAGLRGKLDYALKTIATFEQALEKEIAKLQEENEKLKHDVMVIGRELDRERKARSEIFDKLLAEVQGITGTAKPDNMMKTLSSIARQIVAAGDGTAKFEPEQMQVYAVLRDIIFYATRGLAHKIDNHHHVVLSIEEGKGRREILKRQGL